MAIQWTLVVKTNRLGDRLEALAMMRDYLSHVEQTIVGASGRCLLLGPRENIDGTFPSSVTSITEWHEYPEIDGVFDTLVSIENLASSRNLSNTLQTLLICTHPESLLLFCDQTATPLRNAHTSRQDITGLMWNNGWSVIECSRNTIGKGRRPSAYVSGRARPKRLSNH